MRCSDLVSECNFSVEKPPLGSRLTQKVHKYFTYAGPLYFTLVGSSLRRLCVGDSKA